MTSPDTPVQNQTTKIVVSGMTCGHCVASVTEELKEVDGVLEVRVDDLVEGGDTDVFVESDGPLDLPAARAAVEEAGYTASV
ncbi:heavy metal transporter [Ornithinimicrobium sp. CNJ-824]|uniref:heavy-metal-associated domain-containing protein n=1 Tax=Ornithinimicrobium sp. CNJ-824 TaxID=1904966 RepID=UPI00095BC2FE|nr:heavy-metal-associated domain-containing protein [Ornithinimicrobium sp. CNJ-824]OLT21509.1 heavy metal transporter [Ornithinimicrobium sp. CNJ-824]